MTTFVELTTPELFAVDGGVNERAAAWIEAGISVAGLFGAALGGPVGITVAVFACGYHIGKALATR
jgi:hypothetical protein